jgi:hypothetical protein
MWATQAPGYGYVQYSSDGVHYRTVPATSRTFQPSETYSAAPFSQFKAVLPNLLPNTTYTYMPFVGSDLIGAGGSFRTALAAGSDTFRFLVIGDTGMASDGQARIATQLLNQDASFLLHVGDIAYGNGNFDQFQQNYFNYYQNLMSRIPFFPTPGNHEYESTNAGPYLAVHSLPTETVPTSDWGKYYSFDWGNAHFVSIDSNDGLTGGSLGAAITGQSQMLDWLDRDLRSTRQFWRIVYFHHPPYAGGANYGDPNEPATRTYLVPILEQHGVQLVLNGHEHNYQRTFSVRNGNLVSDGTGTMYVTAGGGGAILYPCFQLSQTAFQKTTFHFLNVEVSGGLLTISAIDDNGFQFDKQIMAPQPVVADSGISFDSAPTAGSLMHINGWNLAMQEMFNPSMPNSLAGTKLLINNTAVPLVYVSPTQVVAQLPFDLPKPSQYTLSTSNGSVTNSIPL